MGFSVFTNVSMNSLSKCTSVCAKGIETPFLVRAAIISCLIAFPVGNAVSRFFR